MHPIHRLFPCAAVALLLSGCEVAGTSGNASVRVVNASMDYASVDLYLDDKRRLTAVGYESGSDYLKVDADSYDVEFRRADASGALEAYTKDLSDGDRLTWLVLGASGSFEVLALGETQASPDKGESLVRLVNGAPDAGAVDVYLTDATTGLADVSPTWSDVAIDALASEGLVKLDAGTYRLRVTAAGSTTDVRLDRTGVVLAGKGVYTIVVCGTTGGVLTDAMLVQQDGAVSLLPTTQARVRAVVGLDDASTASVSVGGTPLVASATVPVLGAYRLVDAGTPAVSLSVDGAGVAVGSVELVAGSDYTLLYTGTPAAVTQSAIADVNRLPAAGTFKVRLINAMSALGEPLSMSVDFLPAVDDVPLGSVALSDAIDAVDGGRLDVTRVSTSSLLYSLTSLSLEGQAVYTQVMFGTADAPTGALRKDR
ncbi:MAG: DUF4397 domain-containing protein [Steroidobacteraceae bacterium]